MEPISKETSSTHPLDKGWLGIPQAAEYLGISQPTLFRWMKKGLLSFYKVGGSTRFTREGLDAVIEKTTGLKEAEAAAGRCAVCGSQILVEGRVQGNSRIYFRPSKTRFWTFHEAMVPIKALACTACGHIQLHLDTPKLKRLMPNESEESNSND